MSSIVADTILQQLGGWRFSTMTGAIPTIRTENSLSFKMPSRLTKNRLNRLVVTLANDDTYTVETLWLRGIKLTPLEKREGIYVENLKTTVSSMTGLALSL